jgi:hypothetical protein
MPEQSAVATANAGAAVEVALLPRRLRRALLLLLPVWFLAALAWLAPAQLLPMLLHGALPQLDLGNVYGSFWRGRAPSVLWHDGSRAVALGAVEWRIAPWSLLLLQPRLQFTADYGEQFVHATLVTSASGRVELRKGRAALPARSVPLAVPLPVDGLFALQLERLELRGDGTLMALAGELQWQRAALQWEQRWLALGDYRCRLQAVAADQVRCELEGGSAAAVNGVVDIDLAQRSYRIASDWRLGDELPAEVRDGAPLLFGASGDRAGGWRIEREGRW